MCFVVVLLGTQYVFVLTGATCFHGLGPEQLVYLFFGMA